MNTDMDDDVAASKWVNLGPFKFLLIKQSLFYIRSIKIQHIFLINLLSF
jgi:hypothetical protein